MKLKHFTPVAVACILICAGNLASAQEVAPPKAIQSATKDTSTQMTSAGHTFTLPDGFGITKRDQLVIITPPESDTKITIIDVDAKSADEAITKAWAIANPQFKRTLLLATPRPPRDGWEEQRVYDYETSPNERAVIQALARRTGQLWVAVLIEGSESTFEKRAAPIGKMLTSLRPKGYQRENFAGRTPKPLDAGRIATLKAFIADGIKQLDIPGVGFSLIDKNEVVFEGGLGVRALGRPEPVDADTLFMAASNTKAMTTALLARAVDKGLLKWDEPAAKAYPDFKLGDSEVTKQVQIRHLVCACTGLPRQDLEWVFGNGNAPAKTTFDQLSKMKPTSRFGEVFQYSNLMVAAGGYIAAAALRPGEEVGAAYDHSMQELLFNPLGMKHTTFDFQRAQSGNHASPHGDDLSGKTQPAQMALNYTIIPARPAGALWTSPHDFSRFVLMELARGRTTEGKVLISETNLLARYQPQILVGEDVQYGMGLFVDKQLGITIVHHGGDLLGFHSDMIWLPDYGIGATILTNSDSGVLLRGPFLRKLLELVFDGKPEADVRLQLAAENRRTAAIKSRELLTYPIPKANIEALATSYTSPDLGQLKIQRKAEKLRFAFDRWSSEVAMRKNEDGSISFLTIDPGNSGFEFVLDNKDGKRNLILRDAQHEYKFVEVLASNAMAPHSEAP